jgi:hypothetical protein
MSTIMDIIVASILGAVITLITLNANSVLRETSGIYNSDVQVQQMLISNAQIIEGEFRNMGCGVDTAQSTIVEARDTSIQFKMALRPRAAISLVKYYIGSSNELLNTNNPNDRYLYRQLDADAPDRVGIVTQFRLRYLTEFGDGISTPVPAAELKDVKIIEITMEVQSPFGVVRDPQMIGEGGNQSELYATALWKQTRLASQNLKR